MWNVIGEAEIPEGTDEMNVHLVCVLPGCVSYNQEEFDSKLHGVAAVSLMA